MLRFIFILLCLGTASFRLSADPSQPGPFPTSIIEFADLTDTSRTVKQETEKERPRLFKARRADEAKPAGRPVPIKVHLPQGDGPFPVVVVSHGAGGDWDTHYVQAKHLASHGYVTLCLEHVGSNRERMTKGLQMMKNLEAMIHDAEEVLARPKDVSFALDRAGDWNRDHPKMRGKLDLSRVGMMGHSFGAYTTMVVCGMRPALDWLTPRVEPGKGLGPEQADPRVKCGVALSPQGIGEPFFIRESFGSLKVPLLGVSGTLDKQQNGLTAKNRREAFTLWGGKGHGFVWITDAAHLDFTDSTGSSGKALPSKSRDDVQPATKAATLLFLDQHLKPGSKTKLSEEALTPYRRGAVKKVEVTFK
ncbi:MAG: alpha/beta hydrolase family protein [Opitutia bacterium]